MRFKDRPAVVTRAGQGIGEGDARALAGEDARAVNAGLNQERGIVPEEPRPAVGAVAVDGGSAVRR